jgi:hypothetical protein
MEPIAVPIVDGMVTSSIAVLILLPVLFAMIKERELAGVPEAIDRRRDGGNRRESGMTVAEKIYGDPASRRLGPLFGRRIGPRGAATTARRTPEVKVSPVTQGEPIGTTTSRNTLGICGSFAADPTKPNLPFCPASAKRLRAAFTS